MYKIKVNTKCLNCGRTDFYETKSKINESQYKKYNFCRRCKDKGKLVYTGSIGGLIPEDRLRY